MIDRSTAQAERRELPAIGHPVLGLRKPDDRPLDLHSTTHPLPAEDRVTLTTYINDNTTRPFRRRG